jgi:plastocyanin
VLGAAGLFAAGCGNAAATAVPSTGAAPSPVLTPGAASSDPGGAASPTAAAVTCDVAGAAATAATAEIVNYGFPAGLSVKAGTAITWANGDGVPHSVTFDDGTCTSGTIPGGGNTVVTYLAPGTYSFHCAIHAKMKGTLIVTG